MSKRSTKGVHKVRRTLADGTVKEYTYQRRRAPGGKGPRIRHEPGTIAALRHAYEMSPQWAALAESTRKTYSIYLRVLRQIGHIPVAALRRREIIALRNGIATTRGNGAATGFLRAVSAILAWARDNDWIEHSPATGIKPLPGGTLLAWTEAEARRAMAGLPEPLRRVVVLAYYTGQRRGDLIRMTWAAYDGVRIRLRQEKTATVLAVPVHAELRAELETWKPGRGVAVTILTTDQGRPWQPQHVSHMLPAALDKLGGFRPKLNVHGLRKLAATRLAEAGCTAHEIAAITGHRSLGMIAHYTRSADQERLAEAAITRLSPGMVKRGKTAE